MTIWGDFGTAILSFNILGLGATIPILGLMLAFVFTMSNGKQQMTIYALISLGIVITAQLSRYFLPEARIFTVLIYAFGMLFLFLLVTGKRILLPQKKAGDEYDND